MLPFLSVFPSVCPSPLVRDRKLNLPLGIGKYSKYDKDEARVSKGGTRVGQGWGKGGARARKG